MLEQLQANVEQIVGEVVIEQDQQEDLIIAQVEAVNEDVQLTIRWDEDTTYLISHLDCGFKDVTPIVQICNSFGDELECGSVLFSSDHNGALMENNGYDKQFIYSLDHNVDQPIDYPALNQGSVELCAFFENLLGINVQLRCPIDERPYIYSIDWEGNVGSSKFSCYLHIHSLTQTAYLEELVLPKQFRRRGIGSMIANRLKRLVWENNCRYLYLSAKRHAEKFWIKQDFIYIFRSNLRNQRRRTRALKRQPGWDRVWVDGEPMLKPISYYRNHPQDDLDLFKALQHWDPNSGSCGSSLSLTGQVG